MRLVNMDYEVRHDVLVSRNWTENYSGYQYRLPMRGANGDVQYIVDCDTDDECAASWYDEIEQVVTGANELIFYSFGEPMVDIPIKIIKIKR